MFRLLKIRNNSFRSLHTVSTSINTSKVLTPSFLDFLKNLNDNCVDDYNECLLIRNKQFSEKNYTLRNDTKSIRNDNWKIDNIPLNLNRRHVELTGPGDNKRMVINAFNSEANGYMLDLEDSMTPSWKNVINAHENIYNAVRGTLSDTKYNYNGEVTKEYKITNSNIPTFLVRSRGLHMKEHNVIDYQNNPISATIFDIGLHLYNNGKYLNDKNLGPYMYIPKLETYEDAKFVNKVISESQNMLNLPNGTTKTTVLLETFPAIFQIDEIIYALKDHITGVNCGRWDYLFSMIKCLGNDTILPDRDILTMDKPFLEAYVNKIVDTCHKRGIHAMGGMSAFIPSNNNNENESILSKIRDDKLMEIYRGCDGAWVAHPGLIKDVKRIFEDEIGTDNQLNTFNNLKFTDKMFTDLGNESKYTIDMLKNNINISLQYISAWLSGNGAVALNGLMEDLATAEISIHQIKQWYNASLFDLNKEKFDLMVNHEYNNILKNNQVEYARNHFETAKYILKDYVYNDYKFLPEVASKYLYYDKNFNGIEFDDEILHKLGGSKGYLSGVELTKHRGNFLNKYLYDEQNSAYKFLGTSNGVAAVNVVAGGNGSVGPYAGGWQTNAMKNRLGMLLPDTLHVSPEEAANCAEEINHHLERADCVQHINKLNNPDFKGDINYYDIALLADMEQGWNTPEKTRISVKRAIENGINVIHIEDQGEKKRCGHLGDKELNTYDDYALILKSANLAAQELLGKEQAQNQWVRFVARTDAYSAKRIVNSSNLYDKNNDEHKFVDWERGPSPDGKYLYLKQGINPETGRRWGLDISIERCAKVVDQGLASHVWMETPDADLQVAKDFITGVNEILQSKGKKAYGLYNHSPSFDWDVKFFAEAEPLAYNIAEKIQNDILNYDYDIPVEDDIYNINLEKIQKIINACGQSVKGDFKFTDENLRKILINANDYYRGETAWNDKLNNVLSNGKISNIKHDLQKITSETKKTGFKPIENITEIIVNQRLCNFSDMLASFGFNMHLITLPEFHITAFNMHKLSKEFAVDGINAFVKHTQRPERITSENDSTYTYYKHQTATGTGVEAAFSEAVGSSNVNILSDSTEADDLKKRDM